MPVFTRIRSGLYIDITESLLSLVEESGRMPVFTRIVHFGRIIHYGSILKNRSLWTEVGACPAQKRRLGFIYM